MIEKIKINNFRSFRDQSFDFSKINILIGENNSGKSSLLKFLLALKQTVLQRSASLILFGDYVDLGNYSEVIYNHISKEPISFLFEFSAKQYNQYYNDFFTSNTKLREKKETYIKEITESIGEINTPSSVEFTLSENLDKHERIRIQFENKTLGKLTIEHIDEKKGEEDLDVGEIPKCRLIFENGEDKHILDDIEYERDSFMSRIISTSLRKYCEEVLNDLSLFYKIGYLLVLQNYVGYHLRKIEYVNPIYAQPERFYIIRDKLPVSKVNIAKILNLLANKDLNPKTKKILLSNINEALKGFGLADNIDVISEEKFSSQELRVKIKDLSSNITDVGYGIALQLPLIFQTFLSEIGGGETLLIEQPEVHLHPKLQANFIKTLLTLGPNNTYFIETHSEHIVRILQVIVKNKMYGITSNDVSIHYFKRDEGKFSITTHNIQEDGRLSENFPSGFYDSSYMLAKELLA